MPFAMGAQGTHDDSSHQGSAKRATANGVASLDAAGKVPVAEVGAVELTTNKNAASGYAGLDASILLALTQQRLNFKLGGSTIDMTTATGTQAITGVGFLPRLVIFIASNISASGEMSIGAGDGTAKMCMYNYNQVTAGVFVTSALYVINIVEGAALMYQATIQSMDADGFTLSWTRVGLKAGTCTFKYIAIR